MPNETFVISNGVCGQGRWGIMDLITLPKDSKSYNGLLAILSLLAKKYGPHSITLEKGKNYTHFKKNRLKYKISLRNQDFLLLTTCGKKNTLFNTFPAGLGSLLSCLNNVMGSELK